MDGFLKKLGVFGCDGIEDLILAGLITGDPVLFVGTHGTAKTMLCERIAKSMGLKFIAYDASKALFEDVLGFPDPYSIKDKKIDYVSTPISISDKEFVLIDEISRANYQMQSKWLEIIRSRRIMGKKLSSLKYCFGAMNPPFYPGAKPLDPALSGRFGFIIWFPSFEDLKSEDKKNVISNLGEDDAPLLEKKEFEYKKVGVELLNFLDEAKKAYPKIEKNLKDFIEDFLDKFSLVLKEDGNSFSIDGRRAGLIKRGFIAVCSVKEAKGNFSKEKISDYVLSVVPSLLPFSVEREDLDTTEIDFLLREVNLRTLGVREDNLFKPMELFSRAQYLLEKEDNLEKKLKILENLFSINFDEIKDLSLKRRFYNFFKEVFSLQNIQEILEKLVEREKPPFCFSSEDSNAIRIIEFVNKGNDFYIEDRYSVFLKLKEIIIRRNGRKIK